MTRESPVSIDRDLTIEIEGRPVNAALSIPRGQGPWPAVVVIHEILGLNADIRRITAKLADHGYAAVAPDLFRARGAMPFCVVRTLTDLLRGDGPSFENLETVRNWLNAQPFADAKRSAVVGFCMGGGFALLFAARRPLQAAAAFYGDVPKDAAALREICPLTGGYGQRDRIFGPQGKRLLEHLDSLGIDHDVKLYPDAGHSFMSEHRGLKGWLGALSPMHARYDEAATADSWKRLFAFFDRHFDQAAT